MGLNALSKLAAGVKKLSRIASDITDEIGKEITGVDKKKILEFVKDKLKDADPEQVDEKSIIKAAKIEFKDIKPADPAPVKKTDKKKSWNQRRKEKKKS